MSRAYWIAASLLIAITVHVLYVLFVPAMALERQIENVAKDTAANSFSILEPAAQSVLFPGFPESSLFGVCPFDVSDSDVVLNANLPDGFWTLTIYTRTGKTLYVLNDEQSGTSNFNVRLTQSGSLFDMFRESADADIEQAGWKVVTDLPRGLAVFWVQSPDRKLRDRLSSILERTSCAPVKS
jgi:uncharacterized membrane protein